MGGFFIVKDNFLFVNLKLLIVYGVCSMLLLCVFCINDKYFVLRLGVCWKWFKIIVGEFILRKLNDVYEFVDCCWNYKDGELIFEEKV